MDRLLRQDGSHRIRFHRLRSRKARQVDYSCIARRFDVAHAAPAVSNSVSQYRLKTTIICFTFQAIFFSNAIGTLKKWIENNANKIYDLP